MSDPQLIELRIDALLPAEMLPVTLGNVVGGSLLVAAVYWIVYRRGATG